MWRRLAVSHKGGLDERRRRCRTKGAKRLCLRKRRIVLQDTRWDQDLQILQGGQPLPQTPKGRFLLVGDGQRRRPSSNPMWDLLACGKQRGKLCCVRQQRLEKSIHLVLDRRHPTIKAQWKKNTSLKGWQHATFCITWSFSKKGMMWPLKMFGPLRSKRNNKKSTFRKVWGTLGEEKALQMPAADGTLLACHEKWYGRIYDKVLQLPTISQLDSHPSAKFT